MTLVGPATATEPQFTPSRRLPAAVPVFCTVTVILTTSPIFAELVETASVMEMTGSPGETDSVVE